MGLLSDQPSSFVFAVLFALMLALAAVIEFTGSDFAGPALAVLIPAASIVLGVVGLWDATARIETVLAIVLVLSASAATALAVSGAGPFSNLVVDLGIIGSIVGMRFTRPLRGVVRKFASLRSDSPIGGVEEQLVVEIAALGIAKRILSEKPKHHVESFSKHTHGSLTTGHPHSTRWRCGSSRRGSGRLATSRTRCSINEPARHFQPIRVSRRTGNA